MLFLRVIAWCGDEKFSLKKSCFYLYIRRYNAVQRDPARLEGWFRRGIVIQLNKGSVLGRLGRRAQDTALWLLEHGLAHAAASDAHRPTVRTTHMDLLRSTLADDFSPDCPRLLLDGNPRRILEDRPMVGADRPISSPREDEL